MLVLLETFTDDGWQALAQRELVLHVATLFRVPNLRDQSHNPQDSHNQAPFTHTPDAKQPLHREERGRVRSLGKRSQGTQSPFLSPQLSPRTNSGPRMTEHPRGSVSASNLHGAGR